MTYAKLLSNNVINACDQAEIQIEQLMRDGLHWKEEARRKEVAGNTSVENTLSVNMMVKAEQEVCLDHLRRLRRVRSLARVAVDGTIFVGAEDFQAFFKTYQP